ncbi:MAG: L-rhamnose/proton symporter RhaT, partial [Candidatus Hydrogenedentales bacterium]
MAPNPVLGVILHAIGGLASASFYIPYRRVRHWAWESYWLAGGFFSWIIAPWILALLIVPDVPQILAETEFRVLFWAYFFGAMWGLGGLTFGLTMRYLGIALGMAIALGYCAAFGTLMPPIFDGKFGSIISERSGIVTLVGVAVCLAGIAISGLAGMSKEKELPEEQKKAVIKEFNFFKGLLVATFSGVMSASMSYGMAAGKPMAELALKHDAPSLFQNLPVLIVVLAGGFTTNFIWCVLLNVKNKTGRDYIAPVSSTDGTRVPLVSNYVFSAIAGTTWYLQFFFYSMGNTKMGEYEFSSWTLHMASIIIFSTL